MRMSSSIDETYDLEENDTSLKSYVDETKYKGVKAMPFIIGNETFEKLGAVGIQANLLVYLTTVFNMKSIVAANIINIHSGTANFGTLVGAFFSDTYFGRYKTIGFASIAVFLGMLVLTLTALIPELHPPSCKEESITLCIGPTIGQLSFLISGLGLLAIGASGIRPCNLAFGADQFNPNTESGRRGRDGFFNWYYFTSTFAIMVSLTVFVYVQSNISWALGFAIPTVLVFISLFFYFLGTRIYVKIMPQGSPLTKMVQVLVAASKKRQMHLPNKPWELLFSYISPNSINSELPYTDQFRFLNKAAIMTPEDHINSNGSASNPWKLCSIQQVEEVKCVVRAVFIWIACIMYYIPINQLNTYVVFQAIQSDRSLGNGKFKIPAGSYSAFTLLSLTIWIVVNDRIIIPCFRKILKREEGITTLQKMGVGIVIAIVAMIVSALVENRRRSVALTMPTIGVVRGKRNISSMNACWLIPQLVLAGISQAFTIIAEVEFFYKEFPEDMRSFGGSFLFCGVGMADYLSSFMISIVHKVTRNASGGNWLDEDLNKAKLDYFYCVVAALEIINFGYFLICSKWYKYKGTEGKNITNDLAMDEMKSKSLDPN